MSHTHQGERNGQAHFPDEKGTGAKTQLGEAAIPDKVADQEKTKDKRVDGHLPLRRNE